MKENLRTILGKATGIEAFKKRMARVDSWTFPDERKKFEATLDGVIQFTAPLTYDGFTRSDEGRENPFGDSAVVITLTLLVDAGISAWVAASVLANQEPALALGAKAAYNLGAVVLPDALEAAKQRFQRVH